MHNNKIYQIEIFVTLFFNLWLVVDQMMTNQLVTGGQNWPVKWIEDMVIVLVQAKYPNVSSVPKVSSLYDNKDHILVWE